MSLSAPRSAEEFTSAPQLLSLRVLVRLRWIAVIGQTIAVLGVRYGLGFELPLVACLIVIAISAVLNLLLTLRWPAGRRLSSQQAGVILGYDIVQLALLLQLTGGLQNPFSFLFLVPVTVSATTLPLRSTIGLGLLALTCASIVAVYHQPLPWDTSSPLHLPDIYVAGLWVAIVCGVFFSAIYARRIAEEARLMSSALTATELVLAREQRLSALDGMAAAAAHELGTPLATIALVSKELKRELPAGTAQAEDVDLLISQVSRCRDILARLANRDAQSDSMYEQVKVTAMLEDLVAPLRGPDVDIKIEHSLAATSAEPIFHRNPGINYGLGNILENAVDFAESSVIVAAGWTADRVSLKISDDGPGFDQQVLDRLGEPFVTTRYGYGDLPNDQQEGHQGMGLGLFIAKTLLERSGATVTVSNQKRPGHGAEITIEWPRAAIENTKSGTETPSALTSTG